MTGPSDREQPYPWHPANPQDQPGQPEYHPTLPYGEIRSGQQPATQQPVSQQNWPATESGPAQDQWSPPEQAAPAAGWPPVQSAEPASSWPTQSPQRDETAVGWQAQPQQYGDVPAAPWGGYETGPAFGAPPPPPPPKSNRKLIVSIIAAVVVLGLVGGGLYFLLSGEDLTYEGREIVEPEQILLNAEQNVDTIVGERNGASNDATACYFQLKSAESTDIESRVLCGPVLFVDGDPSQAYLTFPLQASGGDSDVRLDVGLQPESPEPAAPSNRELLRRPDGGTPPEDSAGLAVPDPPRADSGTFTVVPLDGIEFEPTDSDARIGSPTQSIAVSGIGTPDRYGRGDEARRPAEGEKLIAFEIASGPGEAGPAGGYSIAVQVGEEDPAPLPDDAVLSGDPLALAISVPEDAEDVNLVVTEGALVQQLSLITGDPSPDNIAVWQRANRSQPLAFVQTFTVRASQPGFVTEDLPCTLTVDSANLVYFAGANGDRAPSSTGQAFLIPFTEVDLDGSLGQFDPVFWSLTLPDGTTLPALDLRDEPENIEIAFDVPATFTTGTLNFGGVNTDAGGLTFDTLGVLAQIPVEIAAG